MKEGKTLGGPANTSAYRGQAADADNLEEKLQHRDHSELHRTLDLRVTERTGCVEEAGGRGAWKIQ